MTGVPFWYGRRRMRIWPAWQALMAHRWPTSRQSRAPGCYQAVPAVVAAFLDGSLVAAAWLHNVSGEPSVANFGVTILPAFNRSGIAPVLLHELALEAVRRGVLTMKSCVGRGTRDHMKDCRSAGLPVLSAMGFGGVTEIVLGTSAMREAALV